MDIIGCPERGYLHLKSASFGHPATGDFRRDCITGTQVSGVRPWDFTAALTTVLAIQVSATASATPQGISIRIVASVSSESGQAQRVLRGRLPPADAPCRWNADARKSAAPGDTAGISRSGQVALVRGS